MSRSVLLVDDNQSIRQALRRIFEAVGFVCSESENGEQAVADAERLKPDIIVLDYSMPVMNGLEAAPRLKKILPKTPIIMFTMFANEVFAAEAHAAGVTEVFSKDEAVTRLVPKAESLLKFTSA
jgi:CheY-like chemotaxis protein